MRSETELWGMRLETELEGNKKAKRRQREGKALATRLVPDLRGSASRSLHSTFIRQCYVILMTRSVPPRTCARKGAGDM